MKVLVTGGTGFVGTHLVNRLLQRGHEVAVLSRNPAKTRNRFNRPVETVPGDVLDPASLSSAAATPASPAAATSALAAAATRIEACRPRSFAKNELDDFVMESPDLFRFARSIL